MFASSAIWVNLSPGLVIAYGSQPANFSISMRGIGTIPFERHRGTESDVAVVIDDVLVGFQAAAFKDLIDVERVEVLRGLREHVVREERDLACSTSPRRMLLRTASARSAGHGPDHRR